MLKNILILVFLFVSTPSQAQLLWEISGKGLQKPSYLFGTMHTADSRAFQFGDSVMAKMKKCNVMAGEMVVDPSMAFKMMKHIFMPSDTTLADLYEKTEYDFVKSKIDTKLGMYAMVADKMKPIFISVMFSEQSLTKPAPKTDDKTNNLPLDLYLQEEAKKQGLEVVGLETFEEQLAIFNGISLKAQAKMLHEQLKNETKNDDINKMADLYAREDLDSLFLLASREMSSDLNEKMLTQRNKNMADRIEAMLAKKTVFAAVGAAHLPASGGVIDLLRKKGYTVEPIKKHK